jgi:hypothetical protein
MSDEGVHVGVGLSVEIEGRDPVRRALGQTE